MKNSILIEVCAASVEDAIVAEQCGADRIELNVAMPLGGTTPSLGLLREVLQHTSLPVIAMIRPRESGFCYSDHEFKVMQKDVDLLAEAGARGFAIGFLNQDNQVDIARCLKIREQVPGFELVFHRAFDFTADMMLALECLIEAGFDRVLTSGGKPKASEGTEEIRRVFEQSMGRIEVLPAAGIGPENVCEIVQNTGVNQIHGTFSKVERDETMMGGQSLTAIGGDEANYRRTDPERLSLLVKALHSLSKSN